MPAPAKEDTRIETRLLSTASRVHDAEVEPLLRRESQATLYRTISRISEQEPLPPDDTDIELAKTTTTTSGTSRSVYTTLSVLLLGVFISQADQSLVLATYGKVSSDFDDFDSGTWLISAYILAQCAAQPLYGKLSDIYGRKSCLQASYILFAIGTAGSGWGRSMGQVIASRAVQGAGGAGMISMVSIIITDLVPIHEVALLRSYVNDGAGMCLDVLGCTAYSPSHTAFLVQLPPIILAIFLVQWQLHLTPKQDNQKRSKWDKLRRIDFVGAFFLVLTILSACLILDIAGQRAPWNSGLVRAMGAVAVLSGIAFVATASIVPEPIFPLRLLGQYAVVTNCAIIVLQMMVQMSLMVAVPIFFAATMRASSAEAGLYLIPAFAGSTLGGLIAGYYIKKTGRFKPPTVVAPILAVSCMLLCYYTWSEPASGWMSLAILPGGFATGMVSSSAFVGLTAGVAEEDMAVAASAMYLFSTLVRLRPSAREEQSSSPHFGALSNVVWKTVKMAQRSYAKLCPTYPLCKMLVQLFGGYWSPPTCKAVIKSIYSALV
ncbi:hypothetical protein LTR56_001362 [Elasticomyces elasticus]|nr:hypothetical protein LTR56_001362 [Elasticomyces elasticus]KAK3667543.1 hypothetical protein LTR22_001721 [Elasticomyces elasticus]